MRLLDSSTTACRHASFLSFLRPAEGLRASTSGGRVTSGPGGPRPRLQPRVTSGHTLAAGHAPLAFPSSRVQPAARARQGLAASPGAGPVQRPGHWDRPPAARPRPPRALHLRAGAAHSPGAAPPGQWPPGSAPTPAAPGGAGTPSSPAPAPAPAPAPPRVQAGTVLPPGRRLEPETHKPRPKKIVFEDELPLRTTKKPISGVLRPGELSPVPDYELRYPPLSSPQERQRYAAVFKDQHPELVALQQEVGAALATLQRLEALLGALPPPRSQAEAQLTARVRRELQKKQADPRLLARQARLRQLHAKLRLIKTHIQKFDATQDKGSVYF